MRDELSTVLVPYRAQSVLLSLIAAFCLPIAAMRLIGALAHFVRVRTREIAIRIAIGADPSAVRRMVVRRALATVGAGIFCGTALGAATGSLIAHQLFQVHPADVSTIVGVTAGLMTLTWLASRVEPSSALRQV
jgi:ABC-type antimicrobial peptide transport system permease subunit